MSHAPPSLKYYPPPPLPLQCIKCPQKSLFVLTRILYYYGSFEELDVVSAKHANLKKIAKRGTFKTGFLLTL